MKKFIKRLFGLIIGIIMFCHNFCYADMVAVPVKIPIGYSLLILLITAFAIIIILMEENIDD